MDREITKEELINHISEALANVENAIHHHPNDTVTLYEQAKSSFVQGQAGAEETEWSRGNGLTLKQLAVMHQYLFANAFMSAWYHLHKDEQRRAQAIQPACLLVSGLGFNVEDVMRQYAKYEVVWVAVMQEAGVGSRRRFWYLAVAVILVVVIVWLVLR